jgi:endoglucanase
MDVKRRDLLRAAAGVAALSLTAAQAAPRGAKKVNASKLPRWRGFNLLEKFTAENNSRFREMDFAWVRDWGFDFVRLPLSYRCWSDPSDWSKLREESLKEIDEAVEFGRKYGVHVNINFHRAPGYCVNPPAEPLRLWTDAKALDACAHHWATFARRYKGIPSDRVSFDLLNEPGDLPRDSYVRVVTHLVEAIRGEDPDRLIVADGLYWGNRPVPELAPLKIAQSTRGYAPMQISHFRASWIGGSDTWKEPTWPLHLSDTDVWDRQRLIKEQIEPWKALAAKGVGVHVGEWGPFNRTPYRVALAWMRDCLTNWKEVGWGWSMWNLRGSFGPVDSERPGATYVDFHGHKLDKEMLDLLKQF